MKKTATMSQHRVNLSLGRLAKLLKTGHVRPVVSQSDGKTITVVGVERNSRSRKKGFFLERPISLLIGE